MEEDKPKTRRRHERALKEKVLAECEAPGASVASVALSNGLNANLVHKWRRRAQRSTTPAAKRVPLEFVPVALPTAPEPTPGIRIDVRRGPTSITVTWPVAAAAECASWMRELLR